jgi:hypothetical protein
MNEKHATPSEGDRDQTPELVDLPIADVVRPEEVKGGKGSGLLQGAVKGKVFKEVVLPTA